MKTFSKRLLTFVLACAMVFGLSGMTTFAAEVDEQDPQEAAAQSETLSADDEIMTLAADGEYSPDYEWYSDPTAESFTIKTADELAALSEIVNGTAPETYKQNSFKDQTIYIDASLETLDMNEDAHVEWEAKDNAGVVDIEVSADGACVFTPIGTEDNPFLGTFNGNGVSIENLYITGEDGYLGLFGYVGDTDTPGEEGYGTVENFSLRGVVQCTGGDSNNQKDCVGGAVGKLNAGGTIENVHNTDLLVDAPGTDNVGGIVGFAGSASNGTGKNIYDDNPSVTNTHVLSCSNAATVRAYYKVGGIVGESAATVKYCCNSGWIMCRRSSGQGAGVAGIVGRNGNNGTADEESVVAFCYNTGMITNNGRNDDSATNTIRGYAGICGTTYGGYGKVETHNCYNIGDIPKGYGNYNSITSYIEGAAEVAVRDNYTPSDLVNVSIFNGGTDTQETGNLTYTSSQFKETSRETGTALYDLGPYFVADTAGTVNEGYPILFWQAGEEEPTVKSLDITHDPDKTTYDGEVFDPTGMVVTATYSNGAEYEVPCAYVSWSGTYESQSLNLDLTLDGGYTFDNETPLTASDTKVEIFFDGEPAEVTINGGVPSTKIPEKLEVATPPDKTDYIEGEKFDPTGMTFTVTFDDGSTQDLGIDDVTFSPDTDTPLTLEDEKITISYTYNGVTKDATQYITVTSGSEGAITIWINGVASQLTYAEIDAAIEGATEQTFTYTSGGSENSVSAQFVLLSDLIGISYDFCSYTVTAASDGFETAGLPTDTYLYKRDDTGEYRTAVNGGTGRQWVTDPGSIEVVIDHTWEDTVWTWADDYTSATASRTCSVCDKTQTADAQIASETTDPSVDPTTGAALAGITVYTATATFEDGTVETDKKEHFITAEGSITVVLNKGEGDQETSELAYSVITDLINETEPQEFTYTSGTVEHPITMPFVEITEILGINPEETPFCSYYVKSDVDNYEIHLPTSACMYIRDDTLIYRTAVNGSYGRLWTNSPTYIEVDYLHNWSDLEWTWADDYSSATVTATCHVDSGRGDEVCGHTENVTTTDITHTTTATATKDGVTTYTASATLSDGQVVTGTTTVDTPAVDPNGYITIVNGSDTFTISNATIDAAIEAAPEQTFTYTSHGNTNTVTKQFVLISDLTGIKDVCSYTVTASDGYFVGSLPADTYLYWRDDDACYRTAVDGGTGSQWANSPATIDVTAHTWGDVTWTWADDYSSAEASRTCTVCGTTETVEAADITHTTTATATKAGETTYTATATFEDGTEVTGTETVDTAAIDPDGYITIVHGDDTFQISNETIDAAIEAAPSQTFTYTSRGSENSVTKQFVLISELTGVDDLCSYTVTASDGYTTTGLPADTYLYWRDDDECYRTAVNGGTGSQWANSPETIEVIDHTWGDVTWIWADDYSSAEASRTCSACNKTETATASDITHTTTATATKAGETTYTASATFEDGTEVTDTETVDTAAIDPDGYITIISTTGEESQLMNTTIDAAIEAAPEQTFTYTSRGSENSVTKQFVLISELTGMEDFCSYTVTASDGYTTTGLPTDTYLYWRDDDECYRTAVNGGTGSQWSNGPVMIELIAHNWSVEWTWADDYSSATADGTCTVCGATETVTTTDITSETTPPTTEADGQTVYTATVTFGDGTEVTGTQTVVIPKLIAPTVSDVTVTSNITDDTKVYDGAGVNLTVSATVTPDTAEVSYQWYKDDEAIEGATSSVYTTGSNVSDSGTYKCEVIATNDGLTATDSGEITITITQAEQDISYATTLVTKYDYDEAFTNELTETTVFGAITYVSSNESVATVDVTTGEVAIHGTGSVTITATAAGSENYTEATASYVLVVNTDKIGWEIEVNGREVKWDEEKQEWVDDPSYTGVPLEFEMVITLDEGEEEEVDEIAYQWYRYDYDTMEFKEIEGATESSYTQSDEDVVVGDYLYMCIVTVTYKDGDSDTVSGPIEITVEKAAQDISYAETAIEKTVGDEPFVNELTETKVSTDEGAGITYTSSDESVATVDENGQVTILTEGEVTITATAVGTENFEEATASYTITVVANKTALQEEYDADSELNEDDYTPVSWAPFEEALENAKTVLDKEDATQSEVDAALEALQDAKAGLEEKADKTDLQNEIAEAEALNEDDYTEDSWAALEDALADAQAVADDPNATQDDVEAAEEALKTAMDNLEPVTPEVKDGLIKDSDGVWRLYKDNVFQRDYTGFAENTNGKWYVERGIVTFTVTDILKDKDGAIGTAGTWYYVIDSKVQEDFTGLGDFSNQYGWWYIVDGKVDFTRNSVDKNCNGWWYVVGGKVQFGFTGLANYKNEYGWWYIQNGAVDFNHNGVDKNNNGWYYVTGGKVNFDFTGLANHRNDHGWWYVQSGKVNFNYTGLAKNQNGWFYVKDSKVDFGFTGIASNQYGTWYISGGRVAFSFSGTVTIDGQRYTVKGGKVS